MRYNWHTTVCKFKGVQPNDLTYIHHKMITMICSYIYHLIEIHSFTKRKGIFPCNENSKDLLNNFHMLLIAVLLYLSYYTLHLITGSVCLLIASVNSLSPFLASGKHWCIFCYSDSLGRKLEFAEPKVLFWLEFHINGWKIEVSLSYFQL